MQTEHDVDPFSVQAEKNDLARATNRLDLCSDDHSIESNRSNSFIDPDFDDRSTDQRFGSASPDLGFEAFRHRSSGLADVADEALDRSGDLVAVDQEGIVAMR